MIHHVAEQIYRLLLSAALSTQHPQALEIKEWLHNNGIYDILQRLIVFEIPIVHLEDKLKSLHLAEAFTIKHMMRNYNRMLAHGHTVCIDASPGAIIYFHGTMHIDTLQTVMTKK